MAVGGRRRKRSRTSTSRRSCVATAERRRALSLAPADLRDARDEVLRRIADACARSGRDPAHVTLVAVSKGVALERLREALAVGLTDLGESRVQEAAPKIDALTGARWHLVGRLQSNKATRAAELFDVVHSVDSIGLARRLSQAAVARQASAPLPVFVQVNVDDDPVKAGFPPTAMPRVLDELVELNGVGLSGLMTVGRRVAASSAARATFAALRDLSAALRARQPALGGGLSMGMSDDFEVAIEEGATLVRIGRALFGERPSAP